MPEFAARQGGVADEPLVSFVLVALLVVVRLGRLLACDLECLSCFLILGLFPLLNRPAWGPW